MTPEELMKAVWGDRLSPWLRTTDEIEAIVGPSIEIESVLYKCKEDLLLYCTPIPKTNNSLLTFLAWHPTRAGAKLSGRWTSPTIQKPPRPFLVGDRCRVKETKDDLGVIQSLVTVDSKGKSYPAADFIGGRRWLLALIEHAPEEASS